MFARVRLDEAVWDSIPRGIGNRRIFTFERHAELGASIA